MLNNKNLGSSFDSFLEEEDLLQEADTVAIKRVIAYALEQKMLAENITISRLAKELDTSRSAISRILDPQNTAITLNTIEKVAKYLGKRIVLSFA
mgnify:CR=1 FL=1